MRGTRRACSLHQRGSPASGCFSHLVPVRCTRRCRKSPSHAFRFDPREEKRSPAALSRCRCRRGSCSSGGCHWGILADGLSHHLSAFPAMCSRAPPVQTCRSDLWDLGCRVDRGGLHGGSSRAIRAASRNRTHGARRPLSNIRANGVHVLCPGRIFDSRTPPAGYGSQESEPEAGRSGPARLTDGCSKQARFRCHYGDGMGDCLRHRKPPIAGLSRH
jgi:hypothetical protein